MPQTYPDPHTCTDQRCDMETTNLDSNGRWAECGYCNGTECPDCILEPDGVCVCGYLDADKGE